MPQTEIEDAAAPDIEGDQHVPDGMVFVPGGTFAMGSDDHCDMEKPVHRVTVNGFWIDQTPVTNADFRLLVEATGYVTFAEIAPRAEDYPGAPPHMLKPGSLVLNLPAEPVDLRNWLPSPPSAARHPEPVDTSTNHVGFRCVAQRKRG